MGERIVYKHWLYDANLLTKIDKFFLHLPANRSLVGIFVTMDYVTVCPPICTFYFQNQ
jgi:hypothetical protein